MAQSRLLDKSLSENQRLWYGTLYFMDAKIAVDSLSYLLSMVSHTGLRSLFGVDLFGFCMDKRRCFYLSLSYLVDGYVEKHSVKGYAAVNDLYNQYPVFKEIREERDKNVAHKDSSYLKDSFADIPGMRHELFVLRQILSGDMLPCDMPFIFYPYDRVLFCLANRIFGEEQVSIIQKRVDFYGYENIVSSIGVLHKFKSDEYLRPEFMIASDMPRWVFTASEGTPCPMPGLILPELLQNLFMYIIVQNINHDSSWKLSITKEYQLLMDLYRCGLVDIYGLPRNIYNVLSDEFIQNVSVMLRNTYKLRYLPLFSYCAVKH